MSTARRATAFSNASRPGRMSRPLAPDMPSSSKTAPICHSARVIRHLVPGPRKPANGRAKRQEKRSRGPKAPNCAINGSTSGRWNRLSGQPSICPFVELRYHRSQ